MDSFIILEYSCANFLNLPQINIKKTTQQKNGKELGQVIHRKITRGP